MRLLIYLILCMILLSPVAVVALAWFALEDAPLHGQRHQLSHSDIARAREIIERNVTGILIEEIAVLQSGQGVIVHDEVVRLELFVEFDMLPDRPEVIPQVKRPGRLDP